MKEQEGEAAMSRYESSVSHEIEKFNLGKYIEELETDGLTILQPEVTGVAPELIDRCAGVLLERFTELTGCPITVEDGPLKDLVWPEGTSTDFLPLPRLQTLPRCYCNNSSWSIDASVILL